MPRSTSRAMSVSAAHALHFQIPKMAAPTPPSLLNRQQSSTSPRLLASAPAPVAPATSPRKPRSPTRSPPRPATQSASFSEMPCERSEPARGAWAGKEDLPTVPSSSTNTPQALGIEVNEFEATFRAARPVPTAAN